MKEFRLSIDLADDALAKALARAIAKEYRYVNVTIGQKDNADFTIQDGFLDTPAPVREIMDRVFALSGKDFAFERKADSCPFTAFTAGGGGRGVSSCAALYAHALADQGRKNVLLLSFDPYLTPNDPQAGMALLQKIVGGMRSPLKAACVAAEDGVCVPAQCTEHNLLHQLNTEDAARFLQAVEDSGEWDAVVLDVPRAYSSWKDVMNMCETQVVLVSGFADDAVKDEAARRELQETADGAASRPPAVRAFSPGMDASFRFGQTDLYGQLGCEVRTLAQQLAAK